MDECIMIRNNIGRETYLPEVRRIYMARKALKKTTTKKTTVKNTAKKADAKLPVQPEQMIFALDIGTRSIIGMAGVVEDAKVKILAIEKEEHNERVMIDGQIEDIAKVAALADKVKKRLEEKLCCKLERVCIAAAGRALQTKRAEYTLKLPSTQVIDDEIISRLEAGAISKAEAEFDAEHAEEQFDRRFYLAGYTVCQYYLDDYMMQSLKDHRGSVLKADLIATFLPSEVVESLYTTMHKIGLEIASLTLEPIAAINAAIPESLRLLNLVMADIGAGTSDIAACSGGSVVGYTMVTMAGDEITEALMKEYLVDFQTAEFLKASMSDKNDIPYTNILGMEQTVSSEELVRSAQETAATLCKELAAKILEVNGAAPSALFLAGGGSKLIGLKDRLATALQMDGNRVAVAGSNFKANAFSDEYDLNDPEYTTPLGILISSGLGLLNDGFRVTLNGKPAKLFRSGSFTALNLLMMNGYGYQDILGRPGLNITISLNGKRKIFYGTSAKPAVLAINNTQGKLSDVIHAGDVISFTPAVDGVPAKARLRDINGIEDCISVTLNGVSASLNTPLKNGDVVEVIPDIGGLAPAGTGAEDEAYDTKTYDELYGDAEEEDTYTEEADYTTAAHSDAPAAMPVADTPAQPPKMTYFYLNDFQLDFPEKPDGEPYRMMDMIEYSGIDLKNVHGEIRISVNGMEASFQQPLKEGDVIFITEEASR